MDQYPDSNEFSISVVIPAYNSAAYIKRSVDSVLAQTLKPDEIIVVDDGSTDNTADIVSQYGSKVTLIQQKNAGPSTARNTGIKAATGEWIAFLDADDEWLPEKLQLQIENLQRNPQLVWTTANFYRSLENENRRMPQIQSAKAKKMLEGKNYIEDYFSAYRAGIIGCTDTMVVKKSVLIEAGFFREQLNKAEDLDLWWRIAIRQPKIGYITQPIACYYMNLSNISRREYSADLCIDIIRHNLELAKQYNRTQAFNPCATILLKQWLRSMLFYAKGRDIRQIINEFTEILPAGYKIFMHILTIFPKLTAIGCRLISKITRVFKLRKGVFRKPPKSG
jgi:glycosyltransferase involved in cell wall biosynthesis